MSKESNFNVFEFLVAILLGITAIGLAWSGFQSGLWGGNMATGYSAAATDAIKAASIQTNAIIEISNDYRTDIMAKSEILKSQYAQDENEKQRAREIADYLYRWQMSSPAYVSLGLPAEKHADNLEEGADFDGEENRLTIEELELAQLNELDQDGNTYEEDALKDGQMKFSEADEKFAKGQEANSIGDKFDLAGVIYTVALFFAGLALVFKSQVKWGFWGAGVIIFLIATSYMMTLPMLSA